MNYTVEVWGNLQGQTQSFKTLKEARAYFARVKRMAIADGFKFNKTDTYTYVSKDVYDTEMITISVWED